MFGYVKKKVVLEEIKKEIRLYEHLTAKMAALIEEDLKGVLDDDTYQIMVANPIKFKTSLCIHHARHIEIETIAAMNCSSYNSYLKSWYTLKDLLARLERYPVEITKS